jgi:histidine triad (HIT) family protein
MRHKRIETGDKAQQAKSRYKIGSGTDCLFCDIVAGREPSVKVWESDEFLAIKNKYPKAPVHVLVMPKGHVVKASTSNCDNKLCGEFWSTMMISVFKVVKYLKLDKTGYKLVSNGAGYNHFEHEHIHVLGGSKNEPAGQT